MWKVQLFKLNYTEEEENAVSEVVKSGWLTMGEKTITFENKFGEMLGSNVHCAAVSNGTAALHMALLALGVGPGDEVLLPALTFVADINSVKLVGATPVLVDCTSYDDWNISPKDMESKLTSKTKAVLIVHYAGYPCDMDSILAFSKQHNLGLIEDVAHAPGALYKNKACGTFGDIGCFSFFTNKNLSVGEGGMVTSCSEEIIKKLKYFRSHGMTSLTLDRHKGRAISYDVEMPGLNYRIDEIRAALGLVQLGKLEGANKRRGEIVSLYHKLLSSEKNILIPFFSTKDVSPSYHIFPILLSEKLDRLKVIQSLKDDGIQSSIHYPAFQEFTAYRNAGLCPTPIATDISNRELTLPLYPNMTDEDVHLVVNALKRAVKDV